MSSSSSSPVPPPPALSPRTAERAGANTPAAIGLALALLALALDYLSLSNRLYDLGLGAVDNLLPVAVSIAAVVVGRSGAPQRGPRLRQQPARPRGLGHGVHARAGSASAARGSRGFHVNPRGDCRRELPACDEPVAAACPDLDSLR